VAHLYREVALGVRDGSRALPFGGSLRRVLSDPYRAFLLSQMGRALAPGVGVEGLALAKHRDVLVGAPPVVPPEMLKNITDFTRAVAARTGAYGRSCARPQTSASFRRSRAEGGAMLDLRAEHPISRMALRDAKGQRTSEAWRGMPTLTANMVWREAGLCPLVKDGALPRVRAVAVPERGFKVRVVTAGEPSEQVRGHVLRDVFWTLLDALPVCHRGEADENRRAQGVVDSLASGQVLVSTDLTAATDYATFSVAEAVWRGVISGLVERRDLEASEASCALDEILVHLGAHRCTWPTGSMETRRGWLMGHPLTWLTLNLAHCALLDQVGLLRRSVVKGDDALVRCTRVEAGEYMLALELAGFKVNKAKTFLSTRSGTFCEKMFTSRRPFRPQVPVKRVVPVTPERLGSLALELEALPKKLRQGYVRLAWRSASESGLIEDCRRRGIPLSLPRECGGLGLPHRRGFARSLSTARRWVTHLVTSLGAHDVLPLWVARREADAQRSCISGLRELTRVRHSKGQLGAAVPVTEGVLNRFVGIRSFGIGLTAKPREASFTLGSVAAQWSKARRALAHAKVPNLINPGKWSRARLRGVLTSYRLAGIYSTDWVTTMTQQGLTLNTVKGAWGS